MSRDEVSHWHEELSIDDRPVIVPHTVLTQVREELVLDGRIAELSPPCVRLDSLLRYVGKETMNTLAETVIGFLRRLLGKQISLFRRGAAHDDA